MAETIVAWLPRTDPLIDRHADDCASALVSATLSAQISVDKTGDRAVQTAGFRRREAKAVCQPLPHLFGESLIFTIRHGVAVRRRSCWF